MKYLKCKYNYHSNTFYANIQYFSAIIEMLNNGTPKQIKNNFTDQRFAIILIEI